MFGGTVGLGGLGGDWTHPGQALGISLRNCEKNCPLVWYFWVFHGCSTYLYIFVVCVTQNKRGKQKGDALEGFSWGAFKKSTRLSSAISERGQLAPCAF